MTKCEWDELSAFYSTHPLTDWQDLRESELYFKAIRTNKGRELDFALWKVSFAKRQELRNN